MKMKEKEDRLSDLPDSLLHHILSFLPSTKQAIRTGVLSKRWLHQWTCVPNLIFDFSDSGMSSENIPLITYTISRIIDHTLLLHDCYKIKKFHFISDEYYDYEHDPNCDVKLRFAIRKQIEELLLKFTGKQKFRLPNFCFRQPSLVKLQLFGCSIMHTGMVNFESLKELFIDDCYCCDEAIKRIVSGSPLLRSLEVKRSYGLHRLLITSKSLKRLVSLGVLLDDDFLVDISCPNLVEFDVMAPAHYGDFSWCDKVLEKFLYDCPLLESLTLMNIGLPNLRIASKILRKLVFDGVISREIEISCPSLEELALTGYVETIRLMDLPSSACAALDLYLEVYKENVAKQILEQLQHLNELKLGSSFIETLSGLEMAGISYPLLNRKSLILEVPHFGFSFERNHGIAFALGSLPVLERLVVKLQSNEYLGRTFDRVYQKLAELSDMDHSGENYWSSNGTHFSNLVSHLRTVKITGFLQGVDKPKLVLDFVEFILRNASVLEKLVVILEDCGTDFVSKVSQKVLSFPRCSPDAIVKVLCSN